MVAVFAGGWMVHLICAVQGWCIYEHLGKYAVSWIGVQINSQAGVKWLVQGWTVRLWYEWTARLVYGWTVIG